MKIEQIVLQLANLLPQQTDLFTDNFDISSLVRVGSTVTATTVDPHELETGDNVSIFNAFAPVQVDTLTRSDNVVTVTTLQDHDFRERYSTFNPRTSDVCQGFILGADQPEYNGFRDILTVPNRRTFTYEVTGTPATPGTGDIIVIDGKDRGYVGLKSVTVTGSNTFTYPIVGTPVSPAETNSTIVARAKPRISGVVNLQRANESYTVFSQDKFWAFVDVTGTVTSKSRFILNDSISSPVAGNEYRENIIKSFNVYVFATASKSLSSRSIKDKMVDLEVALYKSLLGVKFDSIFFAQGQFMVVPVSNNTISYNTGIYVHEFAFQARFDVTEGDIVAPDKNVAFWNVDHDFSIDMTSSINLDDVPL